MSTPCKRAIPISILAGGVLYASRGHGTGLALLVVAGCGAAIALCLVHLTRLRARTAELECANGGLTQRNGALTQRNRELTQRNRELESASAAKSRFVAGLSHELRNPLNAVIGFAELMHDDRRTPLSERHREHLGIIRASGEHLLTLIDEALDMARIEAGHVRLEPEEIEPMAIAAACATSLSRLAAAKAIHVDLDPRPLGRVRLDPARLTQVILNYLSNAIKFTAEGGTVRIGLEHHRGRLLVEVSDTGPGIHPADHHRVFDEFVQLPDRDRAGSGLGLAVTKRIVEAQGGEVGVRSHPGVGSIFSAWMPAPAAPSAAPMRIRAKRWAHEPRPKENHPGVAQRETIPSARELGELATR